MPRLITFEIKAMKDVEELLGRIKQGKGKVYVTLHVRDLTSKLMGVVGKR